MRVLNLFLVGVVTILSVDSSWAETYQCDMHGEAVARGWLPASFTMEYAPDTTEIISGATPVFGSNVFEKGFLGSSLFASGYGRSNRDELYSFRWQMDFKPRSGQMRLKMKQAGYYDLVGKGNCVNVGVRSVDAAKQTDASPNRIGSSEIIKTKASSGARASFSNEKIVIEIGSAEWLRERVLEAKDKFGSYDSIKVTEIVVQKPTSEKGYGTYDWQSAESINAVVNFSANEIEIRANKSVLIDALRHLNETSSVQIGINTGRGWMTQVFWKKKGNWK